MERFLDILQLAGVGLGWIAIVLLCLAAVVLSCLSLSGTWLVTLAAGLAMVLPGTSFPGVWTLVLFVVLSVAVEGVEALAGAWGVKNRGGSVLAGVAALVGGLVGLVLGPLLMPVPIVGNLVGMLVGGFALTFAVEHRRLKKASHAAHIAWGSVVGRVMVIFVKVTVTLGMIASLVIGMLLAGSGTEGTL